MMLMPAPPPTFGSPETASFGKGQRVRMAPFSAFHVPPKRMSPNHPPWPTWPLRTLVPSTCLPALAPLNV